ncbi:hypothetical protein MY10362_007382 [Beauveria mimosiformis]
MSHEAHHLSSVLFELTVLPEDEHGQKFLFRSNEQAPNNPLAIKYIGQDKKRDDIVLSGSKYRGRCYFTITQAGDLMLCDAGNSIKQDADDLEQDYYEILPIKLTATYIGREVPKFCIRGIGDSCVLPFSDYIYTIKFPSGEELALRWGEDVDCKDPQTTRDSLRGEYCVRSKLVLNKDERKENSRGFDIDLPCKWTPQVPDSKMMYVKYTHRYRSLDIRGGSDVDLAVDIHDEDLLSEYKKEVEEGAKLSHPHILTPEHHQGWALDGGPEIFYPVYDDDLSQIFLFRDWRTHVVCSHLRKFLVHILSALDFIHSHDMTHGNVGLGSILYKREGSGVSFLSPNYSSGWKGDLRYRGPELMGVDYQSKCTGPPADIYSFGVAILEFLDIVGHDHHVSAYSHVRPYNDSLRRYSRVRKLRDNGGLENPTLEKMLLSDPMKRPSAREALRGLADHYGFVYEESNP